MAAVRAAWRDDPVRDRALAASGLFGTGPERGFDDVAMLAAQICQTPIAYVSVMASDRQWLKAKVGLSISEMPVETSVCLHTMQQSGLLMILDLSEDPRTATHSFVTDPPYLRFYAALRINSPDRQPIGTLCVMDHAVRYEGLTIAQSTALTALAGQVESQIALRQLALERERSASARKAFETEPFPETVHQLAWMAEADGTIFWFNQSWYAYTGLSPSSDGMDWCRAHRPDSLDDIRREIGQHWADGVAWERVCHLRSAAGVFRPFLTRAEPIRDDAGTVISWFGTNTDIGAQAQVERRLREMNDALQTRISEVMATQAQTTKLLRQAHKMEAVGQLTGGIAHDFNNLLTGLSGNLELLNARLAQGRTHDLARYVDAAQGAAKRAIALTRRLLAFSRDTPPDPKPLALDTLVFGIDDMIRRALGPAIQLEIDAAPRLWPVSVDPNQAENALLNLCINAQYAMPHGGGLTITIRNLLVEHGDPAPFDLPPGNYVALSVRDTGVGMTPDVIASAFDPFFTTKPAGTGTGLGLSMVYGFVRQSSGYAGIQSAVDQGTTISLYLPRHDPPLPPLKERPGTDASSARV